MGLEHLAPAPCNRVTGLCPLALAIGVSHLTAIGATIVRSAVRVLLLAVSARLPFLASLGNAVVPVMIHNAT